MLILEKPFEGFSPERWQNGGSVLQYVGENPAFYYGEVGHPGVDAVSRLWIQQHGSSYGCPLYMVASGVVDYKLSEINGYQFSIQADEDEGVIHNFVYGHMTADRPLEVGKHYPKGTVCGFMGNSGFVVSGGVNLWNGANPDPKKGGTHLHLGDLPFSKQTGLPLKPPGSTKSGYIDWLPLLQGTKRMRYCIDENNNQYLLHDALKLAVEISDGEELQALVLNGLSGNPQPILKKDVEGWIVYPGLQKGRLVEQFKEWFNF